MSMPKHWKQPWAPLVMVGMGGYESRTSFIIEYSESPLKLLFLAHLRRLVMQAGSCWTHPDLVLYPAVHTIQRTM